MKSAVVGARANRPSQPLIPSFNHYRPLLSTPFSSLSFTTPFSPCLTIKACSTKPNAGKTENPQNPSTKSKPQFFQALDPFSLVKSTLVATVAAAALFVPRLALKPAVACPTPLEQSHAVWDDEAFSQYVLEKTKLVVERDLLDMPNNVSVLKRLLDVRLASREIGEAIKVVDRLLEFEKDDIEWLLLKAHLHIENGEPELAKPVLNEMLSKNRFCSRAYRELVLAAASGENNSLKRQELESLEETLKEVMTACDEENKDAELLNGLKFVMGHVKVVQGKFKEALKIYQDLAVENPDEISYPFCQGLVYRWLGQQGEAENSFRKFRKLNPYPKGDYTTKYFEDMMGADSPQDANGFFYPYRSSNVKAI